VGVREVLQVRPVSANGILFIQQWERLRLRPYNAGDGLETVGWGHVLSKGDAIRLYTESECMTLLKGDLIYAEGSVTRLITAPLNQNQYDALVSFTFNCGGGVLQRSQIRIKLNRGDYGGAKMAFRNYVRSNGVKLLGLVRRRSAEAQLFGG
jgi:lysozyme